MSISLLAFPLRWRVLNLWKIDRREPVKPLSQGTSTGGHNHTCRTAQTALPLGPSPLRAVAVQRPVWSVECVEWKSTNAARIHLKYVLSTYPLDFPHVSLDTTSLTMAREPPLDEIQWRSPKAQEMGGIHTNTGMSIQSRGQPLSHNSLNLSHSASLFR